MTQINLGCGDTRIRGHIGVDVRPGAYVDVVADGLRLPFPDDSVEAVRAFDFLEHVRNDQRIAIIDEIWRVLKHDGAFEHMTPSTDGRGAFQDPTHTAFWNINSWLYFCPSMVGGRRFYGILAQFLPHALEDKKTGPGVIHTYGLFSAIKKNGAKTK